jgi:hypothetical protein
MSNLGVKAVFENLRSIDSATFTGAYQAVGTPLANPAVLMKLVNNSSVVVTVSTDGVNDKDILPGTSFTLYDFSSDAQDVSSGGRLALPQGTQIYVKGTASTGLFYVVVIYAGV